MKRRLATLMVFLLLGAIINIAVAWSLATWQQPEINPNSPFANRSVDRSWPFRVPSGFPSQGQQITLVEALGLRVGRWTADGKDESGWWTPIHLRHVSAGWPIICLHGGQWERTTRSLSTETGTISALVSSINPDLGLIEFPAQRPMAATVITKRLLPLRPLWPGFIVNTLLYGAICWLLLAAPFAFRRARRRRRGCCAHCGYDLRGRARDSSNESSACPECGRASERRRVSPI